MKELKRNKKMFEDRSDAENYLKWDIKSFVNQSR